MEWWSEGVMRARPTQRSITPLRQHSISSKLFRLAHQRSDARQQATSRAAIEHAMIETEGQVRFGDRHKLAFRFVPTGHTPTRTQAEHQSLFGQRNGRGPFQAESAEVRDRGDAAALRAGGQPALPRVTNAACSLRQATALPTAAARPQTASSA